jgi:thioredoxin
MRTKERGVNMDVEEEIKNALEKYRTVAVVGLSDNSSKASYIVAKFLKSKGWRIIPVNPFVDEVLGEKSYKSLLDLPEDFQKTVEVVDIFRPSKDVPPIVDQAIQLKNKNGKPHMVWMQLGIVNEEAAAKAREAGLTVIMNRCMKIEIERLEKETDAELESIRAKKRLEVITKMKDTAGSAPITLDDAHFNETTQRYSLMLIDCWAAWCGPCRMIAPVIDELARDHAGQITVGKLNVDENPETSTQFCIVSIPTLLIMKGGKEVDRIIGAVPKKDIEEKLKKYL